MGVGTCWQWETAATLPSARPREELRRPQEEEERARAGYIVSAAPLQLVIIVFIFTSANKVMFSIGINLFVCFLSTVSSLQ